MKAIETKYHGHRFRSRLEARWAVFFDAFGLPWEYEPEGYSLGDDGFYLPDFVVAGKVVVEVKRPNYTPTDQDWAKWEAMLLVPDVELFILADGVPEAYPNCYYPGAQKDCRVAERSHYLLMRCGVCRQLGFGRLNSKDDSITEQVSFCEDHDGTWDLVEDSDEEVTRAKYARFDHGETPVQTKVEHRPSYRAIPRPRRGIAREARMESSPISPEVEAVASELVAINAVLVFAEGEHREQLLARKSELAGRVIARSVMPPTELREI